MVGPPAPHRPTTPPLRHLLGLWCAGLGTHCLEPAQPRVRVTVRGLARTAAQGQGPDGVEVQVYFQRPDDAGSPNGPTGDAGDHQAGPGEVRRVVSWDGHEPFTFAVQLPPGVYTAVRVEADLLLPCGARVAPVRVAHGARAVTFVATVDHESQVDSDVAPLEPTCA
jgi:hypothetical protein